MSILQVALPSNKNSVSAPVLQQSQTRRRIHGATLPNYTPESEVYVYTYQLNNTKYHDAADNPSNELEDAGFRLYSDAACKNEVELYQERRMSTYSRRHQHLIIQAVEMKSAEDGHVQC